MTGSVILQSARIPAVIATVALGAMALPVLFTGLNGLDCVQTAKGVTRSDGGGEVAQKDLAQKDLAQNPAGDVPPAAISPDHVIVSRPQVDAVQTVTHEPEAMTPSDNGAAAAIFKDVGKEVGKPDGPPIAPFLANSNHREDVSSPLIAPKRPRVYAAKAHFRREAPRLSAAGGAASSATRDASSPAVEPGADAAPSADPVNPYTDGGFTPNE